MPFRKIRSVNSPTFRCSAASAAQRSRLRLQELFAFSKVIETNSNVGWTKRPLCHEPNETCNTVYTHRKYPKVGYAYLRLSKKGKGPLTAWLRAIACAEAPKQPGALSMLTWCSTSCRTSKSTTFVPFIFANDARWSSWVKPPDMDAQHQELVQPSWSSLGQLQTSISRPGMKAQTLRLEEALKR